LNRNARSNPQELATTDNDITEMPIPAVLIVSTVSATIITVLSWF
jgi:PiT family inorganic phosphate transporter